MSYVVYFNQLRHLYECQTGRLANLKYTNEATMNVRAMFVGGTNRTQQATNL